MTKEEITTMTRDIIPQNKPVPSGIARKAIAHAERRMAAGQSPFKD